MSFFLLLCFHHESSQEGASESVIILHFAPEAILFFCHSFRSTPEQGVYIEETPLPEPFEWKTNWPPLEKLDNSDRETSRKKIEREFGIFRPKP